MKHNLDMEHIMDGVNAVSEVPFVPLQAAKKRRLVKLYREDGYSLTSVANVYNINSERIRHFSKRIRKNLPLYELGGRPPKLDHESVNFIVAHLRNHPDTDRYAIYALIRSETKRTMERRFPNQHLDKGKYKISQHSVKRWTEKLIELS